MREAGLIDATKKGTSITYSLRTSVLEEALLGFACAFGLELTLKRRRSGGGRPVRKEV